MDQLLQKAVANYLNQSPSYLERLIVPLVLDTDIPNVDKITHIHHPVSVIDGVPAGQLETLAQSINMLRTLTSHQTVVSTEWWNWCYVYTQLRISASREAHSQVRIGRKAPAAVALVAEDINEMIEAMDYHQLADLVNQVSNITSTHNQNYWDHVLYLAQSKAAFMRLSQLYEAAKPVVKSSNDNQSHRTIVGVVESDLPDNELLFDSGTADPQYAARAVIGQAPNYQDKTAVVHNEPWLNSSVKGYKFTIYYQTIATSDMPKYRLEKLGDGTANLIFSASNYPDLTFNVLDKSWDKSKWATIKFLNTFNRGIVELQFSFKN